MHEKGEGGCNRLQIWIWLDRLFDWLHIVLLLCENISCHTCRRGAANLWPLPGAYGIWTWNDLIHAILAMTQDLGYTVSSKRTAPFSRLLRQTRITEDLLRQARGADQRTSYDKSGVWRTSYDNPGIRIRGPLTTSQRYGGPLTTSQGYWGPLTTNQGYGGPLTTSQRYGGPLTTSQGYGSEDLLQQARGTEDLLLQARDTEDLLRQARVRKISYNPDPITWITIIRIIVQEFFPQLVSVT